jgi:hypothetical protein
MAVTATTLISLAGPAMCVAQDVISRMNSQSQQKQKPTMATMQQDVIAIKDDLGVMQSLLMDLGLKRGQSHLLKTYVRLLRDLGYDGEDCLQEFLLFLEQPPRASRKLVLPQDEIATMLNILRSSIREKLQYCVDASGRSPQTGSGTGAQMPPPLSRVKPPVIISFFFFMYVLRCMDSLKFFLY